MNPTQIKAAFNAAVAIAEAIRELKQVPSGHLYATVMNTLDLTAFRAVIRTLVNAGLVSEKNDLLTWVGPKI